MTTRRMVVVGGDAAGMSAASQARRMLDPSELEIVAFERGPRTSYAACGLPYLVEDLVASADALVARTPAQFAERSISALVHHEVTEIDTTAATVSVRETSTGRCRTEAWDELVIGTGAIGIRPPLPGIDSDGIMQLRTIDDAVELDARIERGARRAVVVGAGYIGVEVAEALLGRGLSVTVMEMTNDPMAATLDPDMSAILAESMQAAGVQLRMGEPVQGFESTDGRLSAVVGANGAVPADIAILGLGVKPNVALLEGTPIEIGSAGGIVVDDRMHTATDGVWAAGDCVQSRHRITGEAMVVALGTHANKQGRVLGTNLAGGSLRFPGVIGTAITKFQDLEIARTGLGEREAVTAGFDVIAVKGDTRTRAGYYPGAERITVKLVVQQSSGVILGAQVLGGAGSGKRIDTLATAIWAAMTAEELAYADLSYAPPFSPVWDPVVFTAGLAARDLAR